MQFGSLVCRGQVTRTTATVLARLERAGAINLGSLHMAEFAFSPTKYAQALRSLPQSLGHRPRDRGLFERLRRCSRGASRFGLSRHRFGGGSIRHRLPPCAAAPATQTRVSRAGVMPLSHSLDCVGPVARTARDCARLLGVIAGADARDTTSAREPVPDYQSALTGDVRGMKIAVPENYYYDCVTVDVRARLDASLAVFRDQGAAIVRVESGHQSGQQPRSARDERRSHIDTRALAARSAARITASSSVASSRGCSFRQHATVRRSRCAAS